MNLVPEDEDEKHEKTKEDCDVVHGSKHDDELSSKVGKESNQFQDSQQSERSKDRKAGTLIGDSVNKALINFERTGMKKQVRLGTNDSIRLLWDMILRHEKTMQRCIFKVLTYGGLVSSNQHKYRPPSLFTVSVFAISTICEFKKINLKNRKQ